MGRIRTVKPELPQQPWFATLSDAAARTYYGILALVDDHGRCPADPLYIGGQVFWGKPRAANVISRQLGELEKAAIIRRYSIRGAEYLEILGWGLKGGPLYQQIKDNQGERFPPPEPSGGGSETPSESGAEGKGSGKGSGKRTGNRGEGEPEPSAGRSRDSRDNLAPTPMPAGLVPEDSEPNRAARAAAMARGVDVDRQLASLREHALEKGKSSCDWQASWRKWLGTGHPAPCGNGNGHSTKRDRDVRVGQVQPPSEYKRGDVSLDTGDVTRPAHPELVPDAPTDEHGNVRDAGGYLAKYAELEREDAP